MFFNVIIYVLLKEAVSRSLSLRTPWNLIINLKQFNKSLVIIWKKMCKFSIFKMLRNKNLKKNEIDQALLLKRWSATLQRKFRQKSTKTIIKYNPGAYTVHYRTVQMDQVGRKGSHHVWDAEISKATKTRLVIFPTMARGGGRRSESLMCTYNSHVQEMGQTPGWRRTADIKRHVYFKYICF